MQPNSEPWLTPSCPRHWLSCWQDPLNFNLDLSMYFLNSSECWKPLPLTLWNNSDFEYTYYIYKFVFQSLLNHTSKNEIMWNIWKAPLCFYGKQMKIRKNPRKVGRRGKERPSGGAEGGQHDIKVRVHHVGNQKLSILGFNYIMNVQQPPLLFLWDLVLLNLEWNLRADPAHMFCQYSTKCFWGLSLWLNLCLK